VRADPSRGSIGFVVKPERMVSLFVLVVGMALGVKWVANSAEARGRSQALWGLVVIAGYLLAFGVCGFLVARFIDSETVRSGNAALTMFALISPFVVAVLAVWGIVALLGRLGVKVVLQGGCEVHCHENGPGRLEISPEAVRLHWQDRSQDIPRSQLHTVAVDGECLRLCWSDGELLLMPMMKPQTRDGRIRQSQALARILSPGLPVAIRVDRRAPRAAG
jgi:hypothetical protein